MYYLHTFQKQYIKYNICLSNQERLLYLITTSIIKSYKSLFMQQLATIKFSLGITLKKNNILQFLHLCKQELNLGIQTTNINITISLSRVYQTIQTIIPYFNNSHNKLFQPPIYHNTHPFIVQRSILWWITKTNKVIYQAQSLSCTHI